MYLLFLDDERYPSDVKWAPHGVRTMYFDTDNVLIARTVDAAKTLVRDMGIPFFISFDHDLGTEETGLTFAKWLGDYILDNPSEIPDSFDFFVHSQNPVGAENIRQFMLNLTRHIHAHPHPR